MACTRCTLEPAPTPRSIRPVATRADELVHLLVREVRHRPVRRLEDQERSVRDLVDDAAPTRAKFKLLITVGVTPVQARQREGLAAVVLDHVEDRGADVHRRAALGAAPLEEGTMEVADEALGVGQRGELAEIGLASGLERARCRRTSISAARSLARSGGSAR